MGPPYDVIHAPYKVLGLGMRKDGQQLNVILELFENQVKQEVMVISQP